MVAFRFPLPREGLGGNSSMYTHPTGTKIGQLSPSLGGVFSTLLAALDGGVDRVDLESVLFLDELPPPLLVAGGTDACEAIVS